MKKRLITIFSTIAGIAGILAYAISWAFFDIQRINGDEYLTELSSPNGTYTVTAYLNNGGATTSYAVLGTLENNEDGQIKNIYWQDRCEEAEMEWLNEDTIVINGIKLNVNNEIYDYRRKSSRLPHQNFVRQKGQLSI